MTTPVDRDGITATVQPLGLVLDVREYSVALDGARTPYAEVRLLCAAPDDPDDLDALDPRDGLRVSVELDREVLAPVPAAQARSLDLYLHERVFDAGAATVELVCRSDEAQLIDDMLGGTAVDESAEAVQGSLRGIVNMVLAQFDAELEPGDADADFTITHNATNLVTNPRAQVSTAGWSVAMTSGTAVLERASNAVVAPFGYTFRARCTAAGSTIVAAFPGLTIGPGKRYQASAWVRCDVASDVYIDAFNSGSLDTPNNVYSIPANTWVRINSGQFVIPAGVTTCSVRVIRNGAAAAGVSLDFTGVRFSEVGPGDNTAPLDGGLAADAHYTYAWTGAADASTSTRTRLDSRSPDVLKREPGSRAWDFLSSLIDASGLRLFCDEQRRWFLVDPATYVVPGSLRISEGFNATSASDTIDLSAGDRGVAGYAETIVVKYTWTDGAGVQQVAYDSAGEPHGIGRLIERARPFPGAGAAAAELNRSQGKGRTLELAALTNLEATPGQELVAVLPGAPLQRGMVSSVEWLSDGTMRVGSRGLTEILPGSYLAGTDVVYDDVNPALTYDTFDWSDV